MSSTTLTARQVAGRRAQATINGLTTVGAIRDEIIAKADEAHAEYPQYRGHWSGFEWKLGFVTKRVRTKLGQAFLTGDVVLYRDVDVHEREVGCNDPTAYSVRNGIDTAIPADSIEPLATSMIYRHPLGLVSLGGPR